MNVFQNLTCDDVIFEDLSISMKDSINRRKDIDEDTCKATCDADPENCKSFFFERGDRFCVLFRTGFKEMQKFPMFVGAPKGCDIDMDKCVSTRVHTLLKNLGSRE